MVLHFCSDSDKPGDCENVDNTNACSSRFWRHCNDVLNGFTCDGCIQGSELESKFKLTCKGRVNFAENYEVFNFRDPSQDNLSISFKILAENGYLAILLKKMVILPDSCYGLEDTSCCKIVHDNYYRLTRGF